MRKPTLKGTTKERIVQAAVELFYEHGYAATGMADILKRAKANSGSFYFSFKSKEDLLLAVLDWYKENLDPVLLAHSREQSSDPIEQIFALLGLYRANILATDFAFGCPLGRLGLEIDPDRRKVHEGIAENYDGWKRAVEERIHAAAEELEPGLDAKQVASLVLSVMEGAVMQSRSYRSIEPFDQSINALRDYFNRITRKTSQSFNTNGETK
jgi:AcrR family transcriptional regulator